MEQTEPWDGTVIMMSDVTNIEHIVPLKRLARRGVWRSLCNHPLSETHTSIALTRSADARECQTCAKHGNFAQVRAAWAADIERRQDARMAERVLEYAAHLAHQSIVEKVRARVVDFLSATYGVVDCNNGIETIQVDGETITIKIT